MFSINLARHRMARVIRQTRKLKVCDESSIQRDPLAAIVLCVRQELTDRQYLCILILRGYLFLPDCLRCHKRCD